MNDNVIYPFAHAEPPADTEPLTSEEDVRKLAYKGRLLAQSALRSGIKQCIGAMGLGGAIDELEGHLAAMRVVHRGRRL